jgi:L-asparaginase II
VSVSLAHITRGALVESIHCGSVAVVDDAGEMVTWAGDPEGRIYFRSSGKPFQAVPLVASGAADAFGFNSVELALACASHDASARHQAVAASMLAKAGLGESDLRCGFSPPMDEEEKARVVLGLEPRSQIKCECSGEHAGMLAACRHRGWSTGNYNDLDHPLQQDVLAVIAAATGIPADELVLATDGCSIPTFGAPLRSFARAYAVLADPHRALWDGPVEWRDALIRLRDAMLAHPDMIAGQGNLDTDLMQLTNGRILAKLGAEGLLCLAVPDRGLGIAIVDADGSQRGLGPAAIAVLQQLDLIEADKIEALRKQHSGEVLNFAGTPVGEIQSVVTLETRPFTVPDMSMSLGGR